MVMQSARRRRLLVALVAFVVSAGATIMAADSSPTTPSDVPESAPLVAVSNAPQQGTEKLHIGVAYGDTLTWKSDLGLASGLDDAVALGAKWVRVDLSWRDIQPDNPKNFNWPRFDRVVKAAHERGLAVLPTIGFTPAWAQRSGCARDDSSCAPADVDKFAAFAKDAAKRYAPLGIHTWEIWNEPNIPFWAPKPDPAAYTELLKATSKAIRGADPQAYLLMGGLAAVGTDPAKGYVSHTEFLTEVAKLGGNRLVDAVAYHPYTYPYLPSAKTDFGTAFEDISSAKDNLMAVLEKYGTPGMPIWLTETGAATNGPGQASDGKTIPPNTTHVTEGFQAEIATDTVPAAAANPHVAAVFWFEDQDSGTDKDKGQRSKFYGLRRYDGTPKPAFAALRTSIAAYARQQQH
ncbi:cellulase family glycosylhydrolase [Kitasatospora sp. NPDC088346]|uniref:cellulase family glycosylhydrolase n=1 Tax=Kitasatospora sp. NPDC088346 TaxID=3364073 RepID=UPI0037FFA52E